MTELTILTAILTLELYGSLKKIVWRAQLTPTVKIKYDPKPKMVNKKSAIFAPRGPPRLLIFVEEVL